jgi:translation initiation factor 2 alpha subunit (eIF-2alpha)
MGNRKPLELVPNYYYGYSLQETADIIAWVATSEMQQRAVKRIRAYLQCGHSFRRQVQKVERQQRRIRAIMNKPNAGALRMPGSSYVQKMKYLTAVRHMLDVFCTYYNEVPT